MLSLLSSAGLRAIRLVTNWLARSASPYSAPLVGQGAVEGRHLVENPESFAQEKVIDAARLEGVDTHEFRRLVAPGLLCSGSSLPSRAATPYGCLSREARNCRRSHVIHKMQTTEFNPTKATVLVVEDSLELQNYLRFLLELDRYQVEVAGNGQEALQRLYNGCTPRVVLLDMQMPGMDGLETLRILRQLHPAAKVIMCSGVDDPDKIRQALSLGAEAYLVKPVKHLYLSAAIERCLAQDADANHESLGSPMATPTLQLLSRPN